MNKTISGYGNLDSKLWIIDEAPSDQDISEGRYFSGYAGKFLREKFLLSGFDIDHARHEGLINYHPPKGSFEFVEATSPEALKVSLKDLKKRILLAKPNLVVGLGAKCLQYLHGEKNISEWRGHIFYSEELKCKTLFTYRPSDCLRQFYVEKKQHPGQYSALFQADCQRVTEEMISPELSYPDVKLLVQPSVTETINELERLLDEKKIVSYDIETLGGCLMDCIGFCNDLSFSTCIPFYIPNSARETIPYWKSDAEAVLVFRRVKQLLESSIPKVAQNSQYDNLILREFYQTTVRNCCHDTMVMAHDLFSSLPKKLGCLIGLYSKLPYHKFMIHSGKVIDRWNYNALDALANLHIMKGQESDAKELNIIEHYYTIPHQALIPCNEMQRIGVNINLEFRQEAINRETLLMESILNSLDKIFPVKINTNKEYPHKVNPRSGKDKVEVFHKYLRCKVKYFKGAITLDADTLEEYEKDKRKYVQILAKAFRLYLLAGSMRSKLETPLRNGRIHCSYDVTGTDTGRLNSSESIFGVGTNLQNLKKGQQRQMLIPN